LRHFRLLFFLIVGNIKQFENNLFKAAVSIRLFEFLPFVLSTVLRIFGLAILVSDDLDELSFAHDGHALVFKHLLDLVLNFRIIEGIGVDDRDVLLNRDVFGLINVAVNSWDGEENVMRANSTGDQTLDEGVGVERTTIDNASSLTTFVG